MAFQTKNFPSIIAGMINHAKASQKKLTDFGIGSVARTFLEAPGEEIDELYQRMLLGLIEAIPVAAYLAFGFDTLAAAAANGIITFTLDAVATSDTVQPAGTQVATDGRAKIYTTITDAVIPAGELTVSVGAASTVAGVAGNCAAGDINTIIGGPPNLSVTNAGAFTNGSDAETEDQRALRFNAFIGSLSRGPVASLKYGLKLANVTNDGGVVIEHVADAVVVELYTIDVSNPLGYVDCFIYNGGSGASADLIEAAQLIMDGFTDATSRVVPGYKAAGCIVRVHAQVLQTQNVAMNVRTKDNVALTSAQQTALAAAVADVFSTHSAGQKLYLSDLEVAARSVEGIVDAVSTTPNATVTPNYDTRLIPGTVSFTKVT